MSTQSIPPLRIQKGGANTSPSKMPVATNRPLTELSPMALRRNSPSFPQAKANIFKADSSPANSSPFSANNTNSPRLFWHERDPNSPARENRNPVDLMLSQSPTKRSSIENLKRASRVKNSSMFALEQTNHYDPSRRAILDGRPATNMVQSPSVVNRAAEVLRKENVAPLSPNNHKLSSPQPETTAINARGVSPASPSKSNSSPTKSSLSKRTGAKLRSAFDPDTGIWEDDDDSEKSLPEGRGLHRHAKSVTFDQAPPQINEYEMTTPVPSSVASGSREGSYDSFADEEEEYGSERESSVNHDDSFDASLEDTDKTPVVLPEDWRFMSPESVNTALAQHEEDVFDDHVGSPEPTAIPGLHAYRDHQTSVTSVDSNGQSRPLPPLPSAIASQMRHSPGKDRQLSGTIERLSSLPRSLPSPPAAPAITKSDIRRMSGSGLSMEDRIRLMMIQEQVRKDDEVEAQRQKLAMLNIAEETASSRGTTPDINDEVNGEPGPEYEEDSTAPVSFRDSVLRHMRSRDFQHRGDSGEYNPDIPIPSREDPTQTFSRDLIIKEEENDDDEDNDLYSIPDTHSRPSEPEPDTDDDLTSQYSQMSLAQELTASNQDGQETPRAHTPEPVTETRPLAQNRVSLPDFLDFGNDKSFNFGLETYMTPPAENENKKLALPSAPKLEMKPLPSLESIRNSIQRPFTPIEQLQPPIPAWESSEEPGTPDSVIRRPTGLSGSPEAEIPVSEATIKASGSKLKIRPSLTKVDLDRLNHTEEDQPDQPAPQDKKLNVDTVNTSTLQLPEIKRMTSFVKLDFPQGHTDEGLGLGLEKEFDRVVETQKVEFEHSLRNLYYPFHGRFLPFELPEAKDLITQHPLNKVPILAKPRGARAYPGVPAMHNPPIFVDEDYTDRSARRQRGYLMRQNTKVVIANERVSHDEPRSLDNTPQIGVPEVSPQLPEPNQVLNSPRKVSQPTWVAEPWNSKVRRKSIRVGGEKSPIKRKPVEGTAPPLPGQPSNVQESLEIVNEDELAEEEAEEFEDGVERGRLFVKVVGVKDLKLPLPTQEKTQFALTLDNGLHCVTTAWLDLAKSAPIGQEFELVVLNELEFQLTLQMKLEEPKVVRPVSPTKPPPSPKKQGAFGRLFGSPKKKRELDLKAQLEAQQAANIPVAPPSAYELVQGIVARDGSFARAYVAHNEHEKKTFGRPYNVEIKCFNEWAMEEVGVGSSRSKKSVTTLQRRPPYEIGKLELQLLYVPKPKGVKDEDMPKSMNGAIRAMREAEERMQQVVTIQEYEGVLSQQGGDCPYWRRRFFKLNGSKLTAYHETTLQPRATINLAKSTKLIDDKSSLTQKETTTKGGGRRKSAFAEEEEGYMFIEEGFRIRFANGEVIDFYADSTPHKEEWMVALSQVVGKGPINQTAPLKGWTEMVLKREKAQQKIKKSALDCIPPPRKSSKEQPALPTEQSAQPRPASPTKPTSHHHQLMQSPPLGTSSIPLPTRPSPRPALGHARTESHQPDMMTGARSQANSPIKPNLSLDERYRKTKSMVM